MSSTTSSPAHPATVGIATSTTSTTLGMSTGSSATSPPSAGSSPSIASSEPFSRLSRWFSIRRGSMNQYDVKGNNGTVISSGSVAGGKENRRNSIDHVDSTTGSGGYGGAKFDGGKLAMGKVLEAEEDPLQLALDSFAMTRGPGVASERRHIPVALPPAPTGLNQQQLKRRLIVAAIVHSENSYVASLQRLVNEYKRPLEESSPPILNPAKTATLFHRLPEILQLHTLFRISLADYIQSWDTEEKIGDVFVATFSKSLVLEVYSGFINNFSIAMDLARMEAKRKSALSDFFKVKQISSHDRLSFFGLMVKPVQRFPQFILFLQDLLKYTPQGHHDRMSLQLALTQLESLAEMLNERKREAEQFQAFKEMLENISGTFNIRSIVSGSGADNTINSTNTRYLLREDNVTQLEFNQSGFIVKSKKRRLLLLNDKVLCVSVAPKQSHEFGSSEKLTFKWMHPVQDVEIVDNNQSITLSRILTAGMKRGNSLKSNSSFDSPHIGPGVGGIPGSSATCNSTMNSSFGGGPGATLPGGVGSDADNLCGEMNDLMHDYEVMSRINDLVGSLKGSYREINLGVTKSILADIQASIQRKDEEISWVDSCCLQLVLKNAAKGGKEDVTYTFQIENPVVKKDWITELRLAQLALDPNNSPAWQIGAEHEQRYSLAKMPLFVKAYPAYKSQHQTEVCCGCYFSSNLASGMAAAAAAAARHGGGPRPSSRKRSKHSNTLWICSSDKINSHMTILAHNSAQHQSNGGFGEVARFSLAETIVTCMEYVKEGGLMSGDDVGADSVWMGTNNHRVLIYSASYPINDEQLVNLSLPGVPSQILYFNERVFVGMTNGSVLVFGKTAVGIWSLNSPKILAVQSEPISSLLAINASVYFAAGKHVYVINGRSCEVEKSFHVKHTTAGNVSPSVNLLAHSGIGLWISLKNSSIICLYHTETFKHLQDINIASNVLRVTSSHQNPSRESSSTAIQVTALMAAKGMLWVGTNVGITLTIPLPRLEGVPIISGGVNISYHAHLGPVTFLLPLVTRSYHALPPEAGVKPLQDVTDGKSTTVEQKVETTDRSVEKGAEDPEKVKEAASALKQQICSSPVILRRKKPAPMDAGRMAKTLPRNLRTSSGAFSPSIHSTLSSSSQYSDQGCDVYGLYSDLIFVKEDIENGEDRNILDPSYDYLRRSDPDIAAIPAKVSTLDRRLRMKVSRPRSLDLSNWSMESRSSSVYTSSGSDENVGSRSGSGSKNVSRNSSSASHKMNTSDLDNINENEVTPHPKSELTVPASSQQPKEPAEPAEKFPTHTGKRKKTTSVSANGTSGQATSGGGENSNSATARRTILTLTGGRGYVNWRHIWERADSAAAKSATNSPQNHHQRTGSVTSLAGLGQTNSTDAHVIIWEKKL
uniref:Putative guanine nucleotide exchange factor n=1 Tax=Culex tarsalis TaxID=7177 RepID=A0A1Q3F491_CULTA